METDEDYFTCKCPDECKNGKDGIFHFVPIHCVEKCEDRDLD